MSAPETWEPAERAFPERRLDEFLLWAADRGASDVSFQTCEPARVEIDGRLLRATGAVLDAAAVDRVAAALFNATADGLLRSGKPVDCSHAVRTGRRGRRRFRVNMTPVLADSAFGVNVTLRILPDAPPTFAALGVEAGIVDAWEACSGLTLVTGVPGSGKSTLMAAGTRHLLEAGAGRIQSYEAPIEHVFDGIAGDGAMMSQSEVPRHVATFAEGVRASLRRRPAAVVVGEARDRETVDAAVRAADTGIAVYATAHTVGVANAVRRLLAEFPPAERDERGAALFDVLHLAVTQILVPAAAGGRTAVREWFRFDGPFRRALLDMPPTDRPGAIAAALADLGQDLGSALAAAAARGLISEDVRRRHARAAGG